MRVEFSQGLDEHIRAGYQMLGAVTPEEARLEVEISKVGRELEMPMITWDVSEGFSGPETAKGQQKYKSPHVALAAVAASDGPFGSENHIFVFRDLDDFMMDPTVRRTIRSLCEGNRLVNKRYKRPIILTGPRLNLHDKVKSCVTLVDFDLPDEAKLRRVLDFVRASIESSDAAKSTCTDELADNIVGCLRGLTSNEAENALARCLVRHGGFTEEMLGTIKDEKAQIIKKSEVLTYIPEEKQADRQEIGGFDLLLSWIDRRKLAYGREARAERLDYPKGITLIGVPGTGKSYVAAAVARQLGLPGYIMDVGSVFGSLVGESEARMREAIKQVEAQQGCVLLLDEADKAFGGAADSTGDSGVTRRVFGQLLTWLSDKKDRTFVIMTMNRTKGIPPEFLRAGRFDATWYTDLPHEGERKQIIDIHLRKRGVDPAALDFGEGDWKTLVGKTGNFVGSELEEMVKESRYIAFERRQTGVPTFAEMMEAAAGIIPISQLDQESVTEIREWCRNRAKPVTSPFAEKGGRKRSRSVDVG